MPGLRALSMTAPCALLLLSGGVLAQSDKVTHGVTVSQVAAAPTGPASSLTIDSLMAEFRAVEGLEAQFREEKKMAILAVPLVSEGTIDFAAPDRLVRETTSPAVSKLLVDSKQLRFSDVGGSQSIPLEGNPVVRLFVDAFVKVLAGDRAALEKIFAIELHAVGKGWSMTLTPRLEPMKSVIARMQLDGSGVVMSQMRLIEVEGDETVTVFRAVNTHRRFSAEESARIFGAPSPSR